MQSGRPEWIRRRFPIQMGVSSSWSSGERFESCPVRCICQPAHSRPGKIAAWNVSLEIGGYFMRAADPAALGAWYRDCLGLDADENGLWRQGAG
jgi:hypothetical protein